jgi:SAM-dependent methyltransferase
MTSEAISGRNASFWNELCGTHFAKLLGITDDSPESLRRFDDWYFEFYPYLSTHIPFGSMQDKDVLEVGLGYGSVSQHIALAGARYTGLDIAPGPVGMANHRMAQVGSSGKAQLGSILAAPFEDASFDYVVAIGCLHHTGNLRRGIAECHRLLRPGGTLILMVYNAYSYRRLAMAPGQTLSYFAKEMTGRRDVVGDGLVIDRAAYDVNSGGDAAPHTDWISLRSLRALCGAFSTFSGSLENIDNDGPFRRARPRIELLDTWYTRWLGLDVYAKAVK